MAASVAGPDAGTLTATRNDVVGTRVDVANEGTAAVDATENWWRTPGGPGADGTNGAEGPVTVEPWSTEPGPDWNAAGTASVEAAAASVSTAAVDGARSPSLPPTDPRPRRE